MKKILSLILAIALVLTVIPTMAMAAYDKDNNVISETTNEKIKAMENEGLSTDDATYYAKLDDMIKKMEANKEEFQLDKDTTDLCDEDVSKDVRAFREKVLSGDKAAIKKGIKSQINLLTQGPKDIQKLIDENKGKSEYEVVYPDGSKMSYKIHKINKAADDKVKPNGYYQNMYDNGVDATDGYWSGYTEWKLDGVTGWAQIRLEFEYNFSFATGVANMTYAYGHQTTYGVVSLANSTGGVITRATNNQATQTPAEASNQVIFQLSGSVGASFFGASVSLNVGTCWTQSVLFQIYGNGVWGAIAKMYD